MVLIYPKPYVESRDIVFDGQINGENSKATFIMLLWWHSVRSSEYHTLQVKNPGLEAWEFITLSPLPQLLLIKKCFLLVVFQIFLCLFVCLGLTSLWNIWGHITTVPACSSGTLTNVLPYRNAMPQTQDTTPHPVTVYRHGADMSLCYPFMWNVTLEYTATHFNVLGVTRPGNPSPTFHTHQRTLNFMLSLWSTVGSSVESTVPTGSWTRDLWCANPVPYLLAHSDFSQIFLNSYSFNWRIPSVRWIRSHDV